MKNVPSALAEQVHQANLEIHRREAEIYDWVHPEIFGNYEQTRLQHELQYIARVLAGKSELRALDLGCGTGNISLKLLDLGYEVTAVDLSAEMLAVLERKLAQRGNLKCCLVNRGVEDVLVERGVSKDQDLIVFSSVLHHLPDYFSTVELAYQQLARGGVLYICHEPLPKQLEHRSWGKRVISHLLEWIDLVYIYGVKGLVYTRQALMHRQRFRRMDYSLSDIHLEQGIEPHELEKLLLEHGAEILFVKKIHTHYLSILSDLDERWKLSPASSFRLAARKPLE